MGMVRSYGISWKSTTNAIEAAHPQMEAPAPIEPPVSVPSREDSDDSSDSILKNTPTFPDSSQETSPPSLSWAPRQNTLPSKETKADMPSTTATSVAQERKMETTLRDIDTPTRNELISKVSEEAPMLAANKQRLDLPGSPKNLGYSHNKVLESNKGRQKGPQVTRGTAREQTNNKPQANQPKQGQNIPVTGSEATDMGAEKTDERAGHAKNFTSTGKRNKKAKHSKSGSVNSGKMTRSDSSNFSSQGKQSVSEAASKVNKNSKGKVALEENRPLPNRLTSGSSATSTSRRRRNLSTASAAAPPPPRQNGLQENIILQARDQTPVAIAPPPPTPAINSVNGPAYLQAAFNRRLLETSTHNNSKMTGNPTNTTPPIPIQRARYEAPKNHSYNQPERAVYKAENRQFYPAPISIPPTQKGYPMKPPTPATHQGLYNQKSQYPIIRPQIPQLFQVHHQNFPPHQVHYHQNRQAYQHHQQTQPQVFHQNFSNQARRGPDTKFGYAVPQFYPQQYIQHQQYPSSNFAFHQPQAQQKLPRFQRVSSQTAPPTPHRNGGHIANAVNPNGYGGAPFNRFGIGQAGTGNYGQTGNGNYNSMVPEFNRGHAKNRSNHSLHDHGRGLKKPTIVQAARYKPRSPSPPPIVKLSVRNKRLLWPIGPFIPFNKMTCSPWEFDSTTFMNVLSTTVGVLRLPFSVRFLRMLKSILPPKHGDHIIIFPTLLADTADMTPYWERCYYCQQFLFKYAKHLGFKSFDELPMKDWPKIEIMLGTDNTESSKFNIYLSQPDEKRLLFRCVEQKLDDSDNTPKATFFVTVHQTGVNQVQYSDPYLQDGKTPLPPLDGSRDPRTTPEFQYNLPHYLCLNELRGLVTCGFTNIGVPAKRLNFHPFGKTNFDSLWYGMAHLQELVTADDNASVNAALRWDPDRMFGIPNVVKYCKKRTAVMMGNGEPKFAEHDEVLKMNCKAAAPPFPSGRRERLVVADDESGWERESPQTKQSGVNEDVKSTPILYS
ncbi:hypothetical protein TWF718_010260 [Orbilia javanica]|uniref:Uncharacterized protein n=1 Tax=Orbilia javanica TaxID=47235 RepID=A0AAN8RAX6_9PEZI